MVRYFPPKKSQTTCQCAAACCGMLQNPHQQAPKTGAAACCGMLQLLVPDVLLLYLFVTCRKKGVKKAPRKKISSTLEGKQIEEPSPWAIWLQPLSCSLNQDCVRVAINDADRATLFFCPDQGELAYPAHHLVLETTSWNQGSGKRLPFCSITLPERSAPPEKALAGPLSAVQQVRAGLARSRSNTQAPERTLSGFTPNSSCRERCGRCQR